MVQTARLSGTAKPGIAGVDALAANACDTECAACVDGFDFHKPLTEFFALSDCNLSTFALRVSRASREHKKQACTEEFQPNLHEIFSLNSNRPRKVKTKIEI
jgi:hypothetical protein